MAWWVAVLAVNYSDWDAVAKVGFYLEVRLSITKRSAKPQVPCDDSGSGLSASLVKHTASQASATRPIRSSVHVHARPQSYSGRV